MFSNIPRVKIYEISKPAFCLQELGCWNWAKGQSKTDKEGRKKSAWPTRQNFCRKEMQEKTKRLKVEKTAEGILLPTDFKNHSEIFLMSLVWRIKNSVISSENPCSATALITLAIVSCRDATFGSPLHIQLHLIVNPKQWFQA